MYAARFAVKDFSSTETALSRKSEWRFVSQFNGCCAVSTRTRNTPLKGLILTGLQNPGRTEWQQTMFVGRSDTRVVSWGHIYGRPRNRSTAK